MRSLLQSTAVLVAAVFIFAILGVQSYQLNGIESAVLQNSKKLAAIKSGGVAVSSTVGTRAQGSHSSSEQVRTALADPNNRLVAPRPYVEAAQVATGGTLRRATGSDPRGFNPYVANGADVTEYNRYLSNYMASRQPGNPDKWIPELAVKVTSPDDLVYVVELRKGVMWHRPSVDWDSGDYAWLDKPHELTSDDFMFAFEIIRNQQVAGRVSSIRTYYENLESFEAIDRYTMRFTFSKKAVVNFENLMQTFPMPRWLYMHDEDGRAFDEATWGLKLNEHWYNRRGIGTGAYTFVDWEPGVKIEFARNPSYFGEKPAFDRVLLSVVKDQNAIGRKLKTGELDIAYLQPEQYRTAVLDNDGAPYGKDDLRVDRMKTLTYFYMGYNFDSKFFGDKRVRRAMTMSLDRKGIIDNVFYGLGELVTGPFAKQMPCYNDKVQPWPYDLAQARALLDEAGWKDTDGDGIRDRMIDGEKVQFDFTLVTYGGSNEYATLANIWREALLQVGVRMTPRPLEWSTMLKKMDEREFDAYTGAWAMDWSTDLMQIWHSSEADKTTSSNRIGFRNKKGDAIAEKLRVTLDPVKRVELCHAFHELVHEEQPYTFFYQRERPVVYWSDYMNTPEFPLEYPQFDLRYWSFNRLPN